MCTDKTLAIPVVKGTLTFRFNERKQKQEQQAKSDVLSGSIRMSFSTNFEIQEIVCDYVSFLQFLMSKVCTIWKMYHHYVCNNFSNSVDCEENCLQPNEIN